MSEREPAVLDALNTDPGQPSAEQEPDMASEIDDLSRELTAEIEAHRLTRVRADAAEARCTQLAAERDEAMRAARLLGDFASIAFDPDDDDCGLDTDGALTERMLAAIKTALTYPEES